MDKLDGLLSDDKDYTLHDMEMKLKKKDFKPSKTTIYREIVNLGYSYKLKKNEIELSEEDRIRRVKWCE